MIDINHSKIKETNRKKIISLLIKEEEITKLEISRKLNISITTVSTNITELRNEGFVEEVGSLESTGGRKATSYKLNEDSKFSIGIALTPKHIKISLVNLRKMVVDTIKVRHNNEDMEKIISLMEENLSKILEDNNVSKEKLLGVGISIPSTVDFQSGTIKNCYFLGIKEFNIKDKLKHLNIPIYVDNEANLSAYYEFLNRKEELNNLLYVSITEGLGLGIIINGNVYRGENSASGEMGHIKIVIDGKVCKCGARGCLEAYTSTNVLLEDYNNKSSCEITDVEEFEEKFLEKDEIAKITMDNYLSKLSVGISNLIMILDPNTVIIGGDINNLLLNNIDFIKENIYKNNLFANEENCNITVAGYKESYLLGAAMTPIEEFFRIK
ncbi:ROK family transcriptional regulator [Clostridium sp. SHJSY1]|uniref:ROK family transcriptional regulator n=1 Tax=Clostridium sp. SHJSY1 TaxID=2942483 RepID=UPI00287BC98C|nr:ROK family transcriptional regulator [Clostridium sp. SHJSY1]